MNLVHPHGLEVKSFFKGFASLNLIPRYTRHEPRLRIYIQFKKDKVRVELSLHSVWLYSRA